MWGSAKKSKKCNTGAVLLLSIILLATLLIYLGNNNNFFITSADIYNPLRDKSTVYNEVNNVFWKTLGEIAYNGYDKNTHAWFENGPYPPSENDFLTLINESLMINLKNKFIQLVKISEINLSSENFYLDYDFDMENNTLVITLKNVSIKKDRTNMHIVDDIEFSYNFSNQILIYNQFKKWNEKDAVELLNRIEPSFISVCASGCRCDKLPNISLEETGLDREWILEEINATIDKLNSDYFADTEILCDYEIINEDISDHYHTEKVSGGVDSYCDETVIRRANNTESVILVEDLTVIDLSTLSYEDQKYTNIFREMTSPIPISTDISKAQMLSIKQDLDNLGIGAKSIRTTKEPGVSVYIDISCYDRKNFAINNGTSDLLKSRFGFRINIFKPCIPDPHDFAYNNKCGGVGNCIAYGGCKDSQGVYCVDDNSDIPRTGLANCILCEKVRCEKDCVETMDETTGEIVKTDCIMDFLVRKGMPACSNGYAYCKISETTCGAEGTYCYGPGSGIGDGGIGDGELIKDEKDNDDGEGNSFYIDGENDDDNDDDDNSGGTLPGGPAQSNPSADTRLPPVNIILT